MKRFARTSTGILAALATLAVFAAPGQRVRLDDSLSPVDTFSVDVAWSPEDVRRALSALLTGAANELPALTGRIPSVEVRLDTRDFVGERARIYLTLPRLVSGLGTPAGMELRWEATGPFVSGSVRPGQSALVFDGTVEQAVTSVVFDFTLLLDNAPDADSFDVEPVYELEVLR